MSGALRIELALPRRPHQGVEAPRFVRRGAPSLRRQRKVLAPRVDIAWAVSRDDQPLVGQPAQRLIEGAGRRVEPAAGLRLDMLADGVAMRGTVAEGQQDVEGEIGERRSGSVRHTLLRRSSPSAGLATTV